MTRILAAGALPALVALAVASSAAAQEDGPGGGAAGVAPVATDARVLVRFGGTLLRRPGRVLALVVSDDASTVAAVDDDGSVRVHDARTGQPRGTFPVTVAGPLALSPDGARVACGEAGRIHVWELATGKRRSFAGHEADVAALAFSPSGDELASAGGEALALHDLVARTRAELPAAVADVRALAWSADGRRLAALAGDRSVTLVSTVSGRTLRVLRSAETWLGRSNGSGVAFAADGRSLATVAASATLWNADGPVVRRTRTPLDGTIGAVAFGVAGRPLGVGRTRGGACVAFDLATDEVLYEVDARDATAVAVSRDERLLAIARGSGRVELHDLEQEAERFPDDGHRVAVTGVAFSADGKTLVSGGADGARRWDLEAGRVVATIDAPSEHVACSPDARYVAGGGSDRLARVHRGDELAFRCWGPSRPVSALAFSPDGETLLVGARDQFVRHWSVGTGRALANVQTWGAVRGIAWAPDGKTYVTVGECGFVRAWNAGEGRVHELRRREPAAPATSVAISSDGRSLVLGCTDGAVRVWSLETFEERWTVPARGVTSVAVAGGTAYVGCGDGVVAVDLATGRATARLETGRVASLAVTRDGTRLATGGMDGVVTVWECGPPRSKR